MHIPGCIAVYYLQFGFWEVVEMVFSMDDNAGEGQILFR